MFEPCKPNSAWRQFQMFFFILATTLWLHANFLNHQWNIPSLFSVFSFLTVEIVYTSTKLWKFMHLKSCKEVSSQFPYCLLQISVFKWLQYLWIFHEPTISSRHKTVTSNSETPFEKEIKKNQTVKLTRILKILKSKRLWNKK